MDVASAFILVGTIVIIGFLGSYFFKRTGIPDILILISLGALFGPVLNLVERESLVGVAPIFAALAIAIILFDGGLNLNLHMVIRESPRATILAFLGFFFSMIITAVFTFFVLGWGILQGLLLGAIIGGSSSAIVIPLANKINVSQKVSTLLSLESTFTDALCIVFVIAYLQFFTASPGESGFAIIARGIVSGFSIGIVIGFASGVLWLKVLSSFTDEPYEDILTLCIALLLYGLSEGAGGNGAITALIFGLVLGNGVKVSDSLYISHPIEASRIMKRFQSEISFIIRTFFFTYLGVILYFYDLRLILIGVFLSFILLLVRYGAVLLSTIKSPIIDIDKNMITVMLPRGLVNAVLFQLIVGYGVGGFEPFQDIVITVIISTVLICTFGAYLLKTRYYSNEKT
ncbi:MAG: cation:proton antiporter [Nitrososphaerales archaeon]|nr:cation:proton antiporter [Nitrososphaerales archaeon]